MRFLEAGSFQNPFVREKLGKDIPIENLSFPYVGVWELPRSTISQDVNAAESDKNRIAEDSILFISLSIMLLSIRVFGVKLAIVSVFAKTCLEIRVNREGV